MTNLCLQKIVISKVDPPWVLGNVGRIGQLRKENLTRVIWRMFEVVVFGDCWLL